MLKSPNDQKQYQLLTLNNNLSVLLISDEDAEKSAAALAVNVGHFSDPLDRQGMAHFLEHMLFLGTEKYPHSGEYQQFINQHGGSNNAWTGTEFTNYFFDIEPRFFSPALDRFSQFFISPLLSPELVDKERQAIESEYKLKLNDDVRRQYQVSKETANPEHPFTKFSVGNLETLADRDNSSAREELLHFYQNQYSAERMRLVVLSNHSLAQLEEMVKQCFSTVPCHNLPKQVISAPLYTQDHLAREIHIEPVKDSKKLFVSFALPGIEHLYHHKPLTYLSHLLGNETPGSLFSVLKHQGLVNTLSAGGGVNGSNFKDFGITFVLTQKGYQQIDYIITLLFEFIELIKHSGLEEWRYQEKQTIIEQAFRFQEKGRPLDLVSHLVVNMFHYDDEHIIYGDYMMAGFEEKQIRSQLDLFTPDNMRLLISAKGVETDRIAKWYFTPYSDKPIDSTRLKAWSQVSLNPVLKLPPINPFVTDCAAPTPDIDSSKQPELVTDAPGFRVWYKKENEFRVPKGNLYIAVDSEHAVKSARNIALTRLAVELLLDVLTESTYPAEIAGLGYRIYAHQGGFTIHLSGFTAKQNLLLKQILNSRKFGHVDPARFQIIKEQLIRNWDNQKQSKPISQLFSQMTSLLQPANPPAAQLVRLIKGVTLAELPDFIAKLYDEVHIEVLAHGEYRKEEVQEIADYIQKELAPHASPGEETTRRLIDISKKGTLIREIGCNHHDSALITYYQAMHTTPMHIARFTLANHIMSTTFFHELRTKQQLGYVVGSGNLPLNRHPGIIFYVQSPVAGPVQLLEAIDEFINAFPLMMLELPEYQWQASKQGLISQISEKDTNLKSRSQRYWISIGNKDWHFDQRQQVVKALETMTKADLIRFIVGLKSRIADRLILCSYGDAHKNQEKLSNGHFIWDQGEFQLMSRKFFNQ